MLEGWAGPTSSIMDHSVGKDPLVAPIKVFLVVEANRLVECSGPLVAPIKVFLVVVANGLVEWSDSSPVVLSLFKGELKV